MNKEMFTNGTGNLYETITRAHDDSEKDLTLDQIATLHLEVYNPASTRTAKENFNSLIEEIKDKEVPDKRIANNILKSMHKRNMAQRIASMAVEIFNERNSHCLPYRILLTRLMKRTKRNMNTRQTTLMYLLIH